MNRVQGVLLDLDGTLIDSNDAHARAWVDTLTEAGHQASYEQVRKLIGMGGDRLVTEVTGLGDDTQASTDLRERRKTVFKERYLSQVRPFPRVKDFLARLDAVGLPHVIATSASAEDLSALLRQGGLSHGGFAHLEEQATSSSDAEESKPAPDIVQAAARKLGLPASALVLIGDTPYDVTAASRAGIDCIAVRSGGWTDEGLSGAIAVYDGCADLLEQFARSPLAA